MWKILYIWSMLFKNGKDILSYKGFVFWDVLLEIISYYIKKHKKLRYIFRWLSVINIAGLTWIISLLYKKHFYPILNICVKKRYSAGQSSSLLQSIWDKQDLNLAKDNFSRQIRFNQEVFYDWNSKVDCWRQKQKSNRWY